MIDVSDLRRIARARLRDAEMLLRAGRYDGGVYLCGYAVEIGLKARICKTIKWSGFPSTPSEFQSYGTFKTHNLDVLLHLSGREAPVKTKCLAEWSAVAKWDPEARYKPTGSATSADLKLMIASTKKLMKVL